MAVLKWVQEGGVDWHCTAPGSISIKVPKVPQDLAMCEARLSGQIAAA